jgi:hypothetical protein
MITRTAIYEGQIKPGHEDALFRDVADRLVPIWLEFPDVQAVRVQRVTQPDADAPSIVMVMEMDFPSLDLMHASLASPIREASHALTLEVLRDFEGRFYHLVTHPSVYTADPNADIPTAD